MKTKVQNLREERNLTQAELAEKSGLSLRTIQRIEAGNVPKGFTLKALALAFDTIPENLFFKEEIVSVESAKLINRSALLGIIIPFSGIIFPLILTNKTHDPLNKQFGKSIVSVQILLTAALSLALISSPFLQKNFSLHFSLTIISLIVFLCLKITVVIFNGVSLNKNNRLCKFLNINYL